MPAARQDLWEDVHTGYLPEYTILYLNRTKNDSRKKYEERQETIQQISRMLQNQETEVMRLREEQKHLKEQIKQHKQQYQAYCREDKNEFGYFRNFEEELRLERLRHSG